MRDNKGTRQDPHRKQPSEELDFDFEFAEWFTRTAPTDSLPSDPTASTVTVSPTGGTGGLVLEGPNHTGGDEKEHIDAYVKQWVSAGTSGVIYKVTCVINTTEGRTRELDMWIKVIDE